MCQQQMWHIWISPEGRDRLVELLQQCQIGGEITMDHPLSRGSGDDDALEALGNKTIIHVIPAAEMTNP